MRRALRENWPEDVTVTPHSGVQMLDFGFNIDSGGRGSAAFGERIDARADDEDIWRLWAYSGDEDRDERIPRINNDGEEDYTISKVKALEPFLRKWTPVPVLRIAHGRGSRGEELYEHGPSTWARMQILELDERDPETGHTHIAVLALDTDLESEDEPEDGAPYLSPLRTDASDEREFRLVSDPDQMSWFLRCPVEEDGEEYDQQEWVDEWLTALFRDFKQAQRPNRELKPDDFPYRFEHWARYLAMLRLVAEAAKPPRIRLLDTVSQDRRYPAVDVDLILDIGNSRTCGILVEGYPDETHFDLNNCIALTMRDLGRPEFSYREPFESRVEFARVDFGPEHLARRSGRSRPAFIWPGLVRVGPEAGRMVKSAEGTETTSGLSSPKRYIWDSRPVSQDWRFQGAEPRQPLPTVARSACRFLNEAGDVLAQVQDEEKAKLRQRNETSLTPATRPRFSRSSLYGFMLSELIAHALAQINDVAGRLSRKQSELPRRLRNIILTLPSATPVQEQAIMRSRAEGAVRLVWQIMGWADQAPSQTTQAPKIIVDWDEASCTQLVWLYDEITQKFDGRIENYFRLRGQPRKRPAGVEGGGGPKTEPSLRIACIDIGGGTTDLMISTYYSDDDRAIQPCQNVREGFRIAGDDLVQEVIASVILPQMAEQIAASGAAHAEELLKELFGGDVGDVEEQMRQRRRQYSLQVLTPLALAALSAGEKMQPGEIRRLSPPDVFGEKTRPYAQDGEDETPPELDLPAGTLAYIEAEVKARGGRWRLAEAEFEISDQALERAARDVLAPPLEAMMELVHHLSADVVLLSGRPTRLPVIGKIVRENMAAMAHRVIPMHEYRIGGWYPYRDRVSNRIGDPKTTAAVGAMLCLLAESRIVNFNLATGGIRMRSTARFIGEMERNSQLLESRVLFRDVDLTRSGGAEEVAEVTMRAPMHLGFRQMPFERWMASPLYRLDFANENARNLPRPFTVRIRRREYDGDAESAEEKLRMEALKEAFEIEEVVDAEDTGVKPSAAVRLSLHTMGIGANDYWLDTGIFRLS